MKPQTTSRGRETVASRLKAARRGTRFALGIPLAAGLLLACLAPEATSCQLSAAVSNRREILPLIGEPAARVLGRHVFYNNSAWDGHEPGVNPADDAAIAADKLALHGGSRATFTNYTSYSRGINGVIVDVISLPGTLTTADLRFRIGNDASTDGWLPAPQPAEIAVRPGAGDQESDRVTITWPDNTIENTWLQVVILATANTGLTAQDVFYFGNAIGESGNSPSDANVDPADALRARANAHTEASIDDPYDYNRDQTVDGEDETIARESQTSVLDALRLISAPAQDDSTEGGPDNQSGSVPKLSLHIDSDGSAVVECVTRPGKKYYLEVTQSLDGQSWSFLPVPADIEFGNRVYKWKLPALGSHLQQFYRAVETE